MTKEQYYNNQTQNILHKTKRLQIIVEYTNEPCFDAMVKELRKHILSGTQEIDHTYKYAGKMFLMYGRQDYKLSREVDMADIDGRTYQIVKSRI
jgi:hypothetical protein